MSLLKKIFSVQMKASRLAYKTVSQKNTAAGRLKARYYGRKLAKEFGIYCARLAKIGTGLTLPHPIGIVIGDGVRIGKNVTIYQNVTLGLKNRDDLIYPTVHDDVVIYAGAVIVGPVTVGARSVIAANAVVTVDVPPDSVAAGVPAVILARKKIS
ncbi:hypothetical protein GRI39_13370 [Altererythrobacter indicus]|uniref:Serine acetyltransferase n=1 Tax=Altericroceibacterium indicum TaxID=374177 RepID=A0A845AC97_9SPHN|nr:serine acetyltransferase [Altericroceibacterium indicum]MXP27019.1 hypothetical protein [Altericroceibacterium indicum]